MPPCTMVKRTSEIGHKCEPNLPETSYAIIERLQEKNESLSSKSIPSHRVAELENRQRGAVKKGSYTLWSPRSDDSYVTGESGTHSFASWMRRGVAATLESKASTRAACRQIPDEILFKLVD
jgi:uncharacterized protein (UPF0248 family)